MTPNERRAYHFTDACVARLAARLPLFDAALRRTIAALRSSSDHSVLQSRICTLENVNQRAPPFPIEVQAYTIAALMFPELDSLCYLGT